MKGKFKFFTKTAVVIAVFAQTSIADTGLPSIDMGGLNEPLYLTLCGIGLLILGATGKKSF